MTDPQVLLSRRLLLVTGKGGIGKSLVSAALAQLATERGLKTLLVESAAQAQLAPLFGVTPQKAGGHERVELSPKLGTINLDPPDNFREYVVKYLNQKVLYDTVFSHKVVKSFINTIPGLAELMLLGRLFYHCELAPEPRADLTIFDGFASGHFLSLMTTPDAVLQSKLGGPLARETERVKAFLADPQKCGIVFVTVPEALVVNETLDFLPQLQERSPAQVAGLVVNRMNPEPHTQVGAASAYQQRRWRDNQTSLGLLQAGLNPTLPVWTLPELGFINEPLAPGFADHLFGIGGAKP